MSQVEFEPTIPEFERTKTVRTLYHAATVFGSNSRSVEQNVPRLLWNPMIRHHVYHLPSL
jgi:hypothetical protein